MNHSPSTLRLLDTRGGEHPIGRGSGFEIDRDLDPAAHRCVVLERPQLRALAWPIRHAPQGLGSACLRVERGDSRQWLGRALRGPELHVEEQTLPACVEVPVTWVAGALTWLDQRGETSPFFPWYEDGSFAPTGPWRADAFAFEALAAAGDDLAERLAELRAQLVQRMRAAAEPWRAMALSLAELRRLGHDLWSLDVEIGGGTWGGDYMRPAPGRGLWLRFGHEGAPWVDLSFGGVTLEDPHEDD